MIPRGLLAVAAQLAVLAALFWAPLAWAFVAEGEQLGEYRVARTERHTEYFRVYLEGPDGVEVGLEVQPGGSGPWATGRHHLMPAPGSAPPEPLLRAAMEALRAYDARSGPPLLLEPAPDERTERDPWALVRVGALWLLAMMGVAGLLAVPGGIGLVRRADAAVERWAWLWLATILGVVACYSLTALGQPFAADEMTQRVMFGSEDLWDLVRFEYDDNRHPPLFYMVLHGALWFGHTEAVVRTPAALFGLATLATLFALVRPTMGATRGLAVVLVVASNATLLEHSREVGDTTLFLFLALASTVALLALLRQPESLGWTLALIGLLTAMIYSYYLAPVVIGAQLVVIGITAPRSRRAWVAMGAGSLLGIGVFREALSGFAVDRHTRHVAESFPDHVWGEAAPLGFLTRWSERMAEPASGRLLLFGLGLVGVWRMRREPLGVWAAALAVALPALLGGLVSWIRLKPDYLMAALPALAILAVAGALGPKPAAASDASSPGNRWTTILGGGGIVVMLVSLLGHFPAAAHDIRHPVDRRDFMAELGARIRDGEGPNTVVADPGYLHTMLLYYAFDDPIGLYQRCSITADYSGRSCLRGSDRLFTLTSLPEMREGWEHRALDALRQIQADEATWVAYVVFFENPPLHAHLEEHCTTEQTWLEGDQVQLWRCPVLARSPLQLER